MGVSKKSNDNIVQEKSFQFAKRIVRMYQHLSDDKKEFVLSNQVLRSGTSIGANIEEAIGGSSKRDFKAKLNMRTKKQGKLNIGSDFYEIQIT